MKKILKPMLLVLSAVLLVVATVLGTMAYMTSSSAVSNVFTVGNVTINMTENKVKNDGTPVSDRNERTDTNSYHLVPGKSYLKDPLITVSATSDESYLFVRVRNDLKTIECNGKTVDKDGNETNCTHTDGHMTIVEQLKANGWQEIERASTNVDAVFVYVGKNEETGITNAVDIIDGNYDAPNMPLAELVGGKGVAKTYPVFEEFTLSQNIKNLEIYGGARVAIVAYAIQADLNDGNTPGSPVGYKDAWAYVKEELPFVV